MRLEPFQHALVPVAAVGRVPRINTMPRARVQHPLRRHPSALQLAEGDGALAGRADGVVGAVDEERRSHDLETAS